MYIRKLSTLNMNVSFRTSQSKADESALIDSGATDNFIDEDTWKRLGIGRKELARPSNRPQCRRYGKQTRQDQALLLATNRKRRNTHSSNDSTSRA